MRTLPLFAAAFLALPTQAQIEELWTRHHGGPAGLDDYGWNLAVDAKGNVYAGGATTNALGDEDFLLVKYDASGAKKWSAAYAGPGGGTDSAWTGYEEGYDAFLLQYDQGGTLVFEDQLDGSAHGDDLFFRQILADGAVHVAGITQRGDERQDVLVAKYGEPSKPTVGSPGTLDPRGPITPPKMAAMASPAARLPFFRR